MYFSWLPITIIVIWIVCGICSMVTKKHEYIDTAAVITFLMGLGWFLIGGH